MNGFVRILSVAIFVAQVSGQLECDDDYGMEDNPGYSCKDILDNSADQLNDGVYWIRLQGKWG